MALSNKRILEEKKKGNIVISPFRSELLQTSSYDVRLGEFYYTEKIEVPSIHVMYNPDHIQKRWGKAKRAEKLKTACKRLGLKIDDFHPIGPNQRVIILAPGENILAHTLEFIGGQNTITTSMQAKSSIGRNQITVCMCAGWGDIGYINRWTMEIKNHSKTQHAVIVVGQPIAQIIFEEAGEILQGSSYAKTGSYQQSDDVKKLRQLWTPMAMLPKMKLKYFGPVTRLP